MRRINKLNYSKNKAILFSFIPGAGHMYLGLMRQGIELMFLFFFTIAVSNVFNISIFFILLPIMWFYSIFDVKEKASKMNNLQDGDLPIFKSTNFSKSLQDENAGKYIAYIFIILGVFSLLDNIVMPLLNQYVDYEILRIIKDLFISLLLIVAGLFMIIKRKKVEKGDKTCSKDE